MGQGHPRPGRMMPDFSLPAGGGRLVRLSDYRHRRHVVAVFVDGAPEEDHRPFLSLLGRFYPEIAGEETEVLAMVPEGARETALVGDRDDLPFPVLADEAGEAHRAAGAVAIDGKPDMAVYIIDRYGEIYAAFHAGKGDVLPSPEEILDWIRYIQSQCPECGVPDEPP
jgi:peroxiredoxin